MNKEFRKADATNGARDIVSFGAPYVANVTIEGAADILFHHWNCESVAAKAAASKNSKAKKSDDIESYVYRNDERMLAFPGENLRQAIIMAAKFRQDPRSPRKSAMDLYKAGVVALTPLASFGVKKWDYEDARRVTIQRSSITRIRPAMKKGWRLDFEFLINLPEYIEANDFREVIESAGRLIGVGDFRPTYGRFGVVRFDVCAG
jgi:hypothetical protein